MSTYLVAFVVGEYDFVETRSADGILVRVYTPVGKAEQGKFALEVGSVFGLQIYFVCVLNRPPTTTCVYCSFRLLLKLCLSIRITSMFPTHFPRLTSLPLQTLQPVKFPLTGLLYRQEPFCLLCLSCSHSICFSQEPWRTGAWLHTGTHVAPLYFLWSRFTNRSVEVNIVSFCFVHTQPLYVLFSLTNNPHLTFSGRMESYYVGFIPCLDPSLT